MRIAYAPGTVIDYRARTCKSCVDDNPTIGRPRLSDTYPCKGGCGLILRRKHRRAADFPGTVSVVCKERCSACYRAYKPEPEPAPAPKPAPAQRHKTLEQISVENAKQHHPALAAFHARTRRAGRKQPTRI